MKFKTTSDGDTIKFYVDKGRGEELVKSSTFQFTGFGNGIHPHNLIRTQNLVSALLSGGIILNVITFSRIDMLTKRPEDIDDGITIRNIVDCYSNSADKISKDGFIYALVQDSEMGRGWAALVKYNTDCSANEIIFQDHRDNVLDALEEGDWIREKGIDYTFESK